MSRFEEVISHSKKVTSTYYVDLTKLTRDLKPESNSLDAYSTRHLKYTHPKMYPKLKLTRIKPDPEFPMKLIIFTWQGYWIKNRLIRNRSKWGSLDPNRINPKCRLTWNMTQSKFKSTYTWTKWPIYHLCYYINIVASFHMY